jgi:hypothetical protein
METLILDEGTLKQSTFNKIGYGQPYGKVLFSEGDYTADTPLKLNSGTIITAEKNAVITLRDNVDPNKFKPMVPVFGQVESSIKDVVIEKVAFNGNRDNQEATPAWRGHSGTEEPKRHGQGYHNFIGFTNGDNITVRGITVKHTLGDGARLRYSNNIKYYNNTVIECGHDGLFCDNGENVEAWGNYTELKVNSAIRFKEIKNGRIHDNTIYNKVAGASTGPGIQLEVSTAKGTSSDILVENNIISGNWGPAMWVIGTTNPSPTAAQGLTIRKNTFYNCGLNRSLAGVSGVAVDGWTKVLFEDNLFDSCHGYGVLIGPYLASSAGKGYTVELRNNKFKNTLRSTIEGTASGTAIANLIPSKYTVKSIGNIFDENVRDYYNVKGEGDRFGKPSIVVLTCTEDQIPDIKKAAGENPIFRRS